MKTGKLILERKAMDEKVAGFEKLIKKEFFDDIEDFGIYIDWKKNVIFLSSLYVNDEFRGQGVGSEIMWRLVEFSDNIGLPVVLIPEPEEMDESSVDRLISFYKRFGFVLNENDHRFINLYDGFEITTMYRLSVSKTGK